MKLIIIISLILMLFCGNALAWYDYDWDHRIPVEINNSGNPALDDYQFNVSFVSGINATSGWQNVDGGQWDGQSDGMEVDEDAERNINTMKTN